MSRRELWRSLAVLVLGVFLASGCGSGDDAEGAESADDAEFQEALINPDDLMISMNDHNALTGVLEQALTGEPQALRETVVERVQRTNQLVRELLDKVRAVTANPPVERVARKRIWEATKDGVEYRFVMRRLAGPLARHFHYLLEARAEGSDGAYVKVLWGALHKLEPRRGAGRVFLHFDRMKSIKDDFPIQGTAWLHFENLLPVKKITLLMRDVAYQDEEPLSAAYQFGRTAAGLRGFRFMARADMRGEDARENLAVRAGWISGGAGRADAVMWGGDIEQTRVVAHECWNEDGERVFLEAHPDPDNLSFGTREACAELLREDYDHPDPDNVEGEVSEDLFDIEELPSDAAASESPAE